MVRLSLSNFLLLAFLFLTLDGFQAFQFPEKCLIVQQFFRDGSRYVVGSSHRLLSQPRNTPTACVMETIRPRAPAISRVAASCARGISQVRNNSISAPSALTPTIAEAGLWGPDPDTTTPSRHVSRPDGYIQDCPSAGTRLFQKATKRIYSKACFIEDTRAS